MSKNTQTEKLREWFEGFQSGFNRAVLVAGEIRESLLDEIRLKLIGLEKESMDKDREERILLLIDTPGGDVDTTYQLGDFIDCLSSPVDGLVVGHAGSMGADLLQMCRKRMMLPNATLFHHFTRTGFNFILRGNKVSEQDIRDLCQKAQSNHDNRVALYQKRTGMTKRQVFDLFRQGEDAKIDINPKQALEMGLIDGIEKDFRFFPEL